MSSNSSSHIQPVDLNCQRLDAPLGLTCLQPKLGWRLATSGRRGAGQSAYRIIVATNCEALARQQYDLWDSGKVDSAQSTAIVYQGRALASRMRCWWQVRVWDESGQPSEWSDPACWEMGLLDRDQWEAHWIAAKENRMAIAAPTLGEWIWPQRADQAKPTRLRSTFNLRFGFPRAYGSIWIAAGAAYYVLINGKKVAEGEAPKTICEHLLPWDHFIVGQNKVEIVVKHGGSVGLAATLRVYQPDGSYCDLATDERWVGAVGEDDQLPHWRGVTRVTDRDRPGALPFDAPRRSVEMFRSFDLAQTPVKARAYVVGLGTYVLRLNGQRVGDARLAPGWTDFPKRLYYQTYDVTDLLVEGANGLEATLGNGWWTSGMGNLNDARFASAEEPLQLLLRLEVEMADGSRHAVVTDGDWATRPSAIVYDTLYHGETFDARLLEDAQPTASAARVLDGEPSKIIEGDIAVPLRVVETLSPVSITSAEPGTFIVDFGQNHSGWCRVNVDAPAGTRIDLQYGELLNADGTLYTENYRTARTTDTLITAGRPISWEPEFTYRGYRYVQVTGWPSEAVLSEDAIVSRVVHSDVSVAGRFACSNLILNRMWQNVMWGQRSNLYAVPTDCPQRDERLGWTGDAQAFASTSCWNMDMWRYYRKWIIDLLDAQRADGGIPHVAPVCVTEGISPVWGDVIAILPWTLYRFYGDSQVLAQTYPAIRKWVGYYNRHAKGDLVTDHPCFGDWVPVQETPPEIFNSIYYFYSTRLLARMATVLGDADGAREYGALADRIAKAFHQRYFDTANNEYVPGTQAALVTPLALGLTPAPLRQAIADRLAEKIREAGEHLTTGFIGTAYALPTLSELGYHDLAFRVASARDYPSLGYMIERGATTVWERWDSDATGPAMNSRNHFCFGTIAQWFYEYVAGIQVDEAAPGFAHFDIKPGPATGLNAAEASYDSVRGRIVSRWSINEGLFDWHIQVPPNSTATLYLPTTDIESIQEQGAPGGQPLAIDAAAASESRVRIEATSGAYHLTAEYSPTANLTAP